VLFGRDSIARTRSRASAPASFPEQFWDRSVIDEIVKVNRARPAIADLTGPGRANEGNSRRHLVGCLRSRAAARDRQSGPDSAGKTILAIVPSFAERYFVDLLCLKGSNKMADAPRRPRTMNDGPAPKRRAAFKKVNRESGRRAAEADPPSPASRSR